jgi:hypothetical protein
MLQHLISCRYFTLHIFASCGPTFLVQLTLISLAMIISMRIAVQCRGRESCAFQVVQCLANSRFLLSHVAGRDVSSVFMF